MKNQKGSATVWIIILLVVVIIVGAGYWYWSQNAMQQTAVASAQIPTSQTTGQSTTTQTQPTTEATQQTNSIPVSNPNPTNQTAQLVTVQNKNGEMTATPAASGAWKFTFNGSFAEQQQSYILDFGDGAQVSVQCETMAANDQPVCNQLAPLTHTYAKAGTYQVQLLETFVGAGPGNEQMTTLLTLQVSN